MIFGDTIYAASTAAPAAQQQANPVIMWIWIIGMIAVYYFLVILPQNKKNKAHNNLLNSLEVGDEVITASGIKGGRRTTGYRKRRTSGDGWMNGCGTG